MLLMLQNESLSLQDSTVEYSLSKSSASASTFTANKQGSIQQLK